MPEKLQVLIIEDRAADAELMAKELEKAGFPLDWQRVDSAAMVRFRLTPRLDLILADYSLPTLTGPDILRIVAESGLNIPVIIVSGALDDEEASKCLELGAIDYILKDRMARLGPAVLRALEEGKVRRGKVHAEEALRRSEDLLKSIMYTIDDVVWSMTLPDAKIAYLNPAAETFLGRPLAEFDSEPDLWVTCVHPDDRAAVASAHEVAKRWGASEYECRVVRPDGSIRQATTRCWVAYGSDGKPLRMDGIILDVTDRRLADEARVALEVGRQERARLAQINEFKSQFIGMVAHDLNNVLTPMRTNLEIADQQLSRHANIDRQPLARLDASVQRMAGFLSDMLDASRLQSGQLAFDAQPFDLAESLRQTVDLYRSEAVASGVQLTDDVPDTLPLTADQRRIEQVMTNLLSNALKFTPRGGTVHVSLAKTNQGVLLGVKDTGPGVAAADVPRLFEPFARLLGTPQGKHTGTGLGLYITRGIVEALGGTVWCDSAGPGHGATFWVELPSVAVDRPQPPARAASHTDATARTGLSRVEPADGLSPSTELRGSPSRPTRPKSHRNLD